MDKALAALKDPLTTKSAQYEEIVAFPEDEEFSIITKDREELPRTSHETDDSIFNLIQEIYQSQDDLNLHIDV